MGHGVVSLSVAFSVAPSMVAHGFRLMCGFIVHLEIVCVPVARLCFSKVVVAPPRGGVLTSDNGGLGMPRNTREP